MIIGVPKEIKNHEYRVGLTPRSVKEFINHGHKVLVQTNNHFIFPINLIKNSMYLQQ